MKKLFLLIITGMILFTGCTKKQQVASENPFFGEWKTPFGVPPFDKIKNEHFLPAIIEGIARHDSEIAAIVADTNKPDFANTILVLDKSGDLLTRVNSVFSNLNEAYTNDEMQELALQIGPKVSEHRDNIFLNDKLFLKIKSVYDNRFSSNLDSLQVRVVEKYYKSFVRNGANLDTTQKDELRKINDKLTNLTITFGQNLLAETNKSLRLVIDNKEDLKGLTENIIAGAAEQAKVDSLEGKWVFTLQKPSMIPFLQYAENRALREKIYKGYYMRGNNGNEFDNKALVKEIAELRASKAKLLGFKNFAAYVIDVNMAKTPEAAYKFLNDLWVPSLKVAKDEVKEMQSIIDKEGGDFKLASWDWLYYAEKLRKQKYNLDESELKPYFKLENVREGMFWVANQLYGISFVKLDSMPVYNPDVEVYEAKDTNGALLGILYLDYFPCLGKQGGAWCTTFRDPVYRKDIKIAPVVSIVCNFTKPAGDVPSLLTWDEVTTIFHEFGHGLHTLFTDGKYDKTAGNVPNDYVELPSQVMENWAAEPVVLKHYGKHYQTGETIPDELIKKIQNSGLFNQGFDMTEYLAASILDLDYHILADGAKIDDVLAFESNSMNKIGLIEEIIPRYRSTYFAHIFDGGYEAGYYVYMWAAVLDADAFAAFKESGDIFNKDLAAGFRKYCLAEIGDHDPMAQYIKFRGKKPSVEPLLIRKGLK
jgi:peptidyl-dipeptidase Dcp